MKKKILACLLAAAVAVLFVGCGKKTESPMDGDGMINEDAAAEDTASDASNEAAGDVAGDAAEGASMGNPWVDISFDEIQGKIAGLMIPGGAEAPVCRWNESIQMAEIDFTLNGEPHSMRFQNGSEFEDISGLYYEWDSEYDTLINDRTAKVRRVKDTERELEIDSTIWFDAEIGTNYSLLTEAKDLDGFDSEGLAGLIYFEQDAEEFYPNDFLQERTGKDTFSSFDEMIESLEEGEGYALLDMEGIDGQILAISDGIFDNMDGNMASIEAFFYAVQDDGVVRNIGNAFSFGTAYPIRCDGKKIYGGGNHSYEDMAICPQTQSLIVTTSITQIYDEDGNATYSGFYRETPDFDAEDKDIEISTEEEFYAYYDESVKAPVINFTK